MEKKKDIWLNHEEFEVGDEIDCLDFQVVEEKMYSKIYYKQGIRELDENSTYSTSIDDGYICGLFSFTNSFSLLFVKYRAGSVSDSYSVHIKREDIIGYEVVEDVEDLIFIKDPNPNSFKNNLKMRGGLLPSLATGLHDTFSKYKIEKSSGYIYKLSFFDKNSQVNELLLYSKKINSFISTLFLKKHYVKEVPELEVTIKEIFNSGGDTRCYIATACYGDLYSDEVIMFRKFRDNTLLKTWYGPTLVAIYYKISPFACKFLSPEANITLMTKKLLDKVYNNIKKNIH